MCMVLLGDGTVRKGGRTVCKRLQKPILEWRCILGDNLTDSSDLNYVRSARS